MRRVNVVESPKKKIHFKTPLIRHSIPCCIKVSGIGYRSKNLILYKTFSFTRRWTDSGMFTRGKDRWYLTECFSKLLSITIIIRVRIKKQQNHKKTNFPWNYYISKISKIWFKKTVFFNISSNNSCFTINRDYILITKNQNRLRSVWIVMLNCITVLIHFMLFSTVPALGKNVFLKRTLFLSIINSKMLMNSLNFVITHIYYWMSSSFQFN